MVQEQLIVSVNPNYAVGGEVLTELPALVGVNSGLEKHQNGERSENNLNVFLTP